MMMADRMAADGFVAAGYQYVTVDDCWLANTRDDQGRLQPDPTRFSRGMKHLADYVRRYRITTCISTCDVTRNSAPVDKYPSRPLPPLGLQAAAPP